VPTPPHHGTSKFGIHHGTDDLRLAVPLRKHPEAAAHNPPTRLRIHQVQQADEVLLPGVEEELLA
jgi:hypothetical protein